jgi:6-phosphogluconolactonase
MVPRDDPDSNYRMLAETLVERSGATAHPVPTAGSAEQAAAAYGELIRERVPDGAGGMPVFDAALLGLGEDGHTASLFPSSPALQVHGEVCIAVHDAPKPPPDRVTLSLEVLRAVRRRTMLATGAAKAGAIAAVLAGPDPAVPASLLADDALELIADGDAAGGSG